MRTQKSIKFWLVVTLFFLATYGGGAVVYAQTELQSQPTTDSPAPTNVPASSSSEMQSLFFSADDIASINDAQAVYEKNHRGSTALDEEDFLKKLSGSDKKTIQDSTYFTYPQFFLSSIMYHSPTDWAVWINGEKITQKEIENKSHLFVVDVNGQKVTLEWRPERMDKITDVAASTKNSTQNPVSVDLLNNKVEFTLKGNQTFTSYSMKIVEGRVSPVTVDRSGQKIDLGALPPPSSPAAPATPTMPPSMPAMPPAMPTIPMPPTIPVR
jgi:hypothetical protein